MTILWSFHEHRNTKLESLTINNLDKMNIIYDRIHVIYHITYTSTLTAYIDAVNPI